MSGRTRRSAWTASMQLLFTVLTVLIGVFTTPWLLRTLGADVFGAFRILLDAAGYLTLFDAGLSGALMVCLAAALGSGKADAVYGARAAGLRLYVPLTVAALAAGLLLFAALAHLGSWRPLPASEVRMAGWILTLPNILIPLATFRALAEARQRGYLINLSLTVQSVLTTLLLVLAAQAGFGLVGQSAAVATGLFVVAPILIWDGARAFPHWLAATPDAGITKKAAALQWPTLAHQTSLRAGLLSDNLVAGLVISPAAVPALFLTQRLATLARAQLSGAGGATWAGLAELHFQTQGDLFRERLLELTGLVSSIGIVLLAPIAAYNQQFMSRWVGSALYAGGIVSVVTCFNAWLWPLASLWMAVLAGTGHVARVAPYSIAFVAVNLAVSLAATYQFGIVGPALGTLIALVTVSAWAVPGLLSDCLQVPAVRLWTHALKPLRWGVPYIAAVWLAAQSHTAAGWIGLACEMALAVAAGLLLWFLSLGEQARAAWRNRLRGILPL
ncbi:MAG: hypothetical protein ABIZ80_04515 [Bryobacteraceae bacterium]